MLQYKQRYKNLLHIINGYGWHELPEEVQIVNCVQLCFILLKEIERDDKLAALPLKQRVVFCKKIYAGIIAQLEFLFLLYHALQFHPAGEETDTLFWENERRRLDRFAKQESAVYNYYKSKRTHLDEYYYGNLALRYQPGPSTTSRFVLLAKARALERYAAFANRQLQRRRLH